MFYVYKWYIKDTFVYMTISSQAKGISITVPQKVQRLTGEDEYQ